MTYERREEKANFHLLAVSIAADLSDVRLHGEAISLEAMNAKVLVARAGTMALGFRPLTDFMMRLADNTIRLVQEIDAEALAVSHQAVSRLRTLNAVNMAMKAHSLSQASGARFREGIQGFVDHISEQDFQAEAKVLQRARHLMKLLEEIAEQMVAAGAISSSSRIEAAAIDERYSKSFQSVADKLEQCSTAVLSRVKANLALLMYAINT